MKLSNPGGARPDPWDRNPVNLGSNSENVMNEGDGAGIPTIYTVPTGKKALINSVQAGLLAEVAAATVTSTHRTYVLWRAEILPSPTGNLIFINLHSDTLAPGDRDHAELAHAGVLLPGDKLVSVQEFQGTAAGAGRAHWTLGHSVTEFDA